MNKYKWKNSIISLLVVVLVLTGCGSVGLAKDSEFTSNYTNIEQIPDNIYVSSAKVIYKGLGSEPSKMDFYVIGSSEMLSLYYDGATAINDRYDQSLSAVQLQTGDIATIAYNSNLNKVGAIVLDSNAFVIDKVSRYTISPSEQTFYVGDSAYSISPNTKVFSGNQEISIDQLINNDVLTIQGEGREIISIRVDDGHGYLELVGEDGLLGGWIEIGQSVISQIADNMLFTVPEGDYQVRLTAEGIEEYRNVSIKRNEITELEVGDIVSAVPDKGVVSFQITPSNAYVELDGKHINTSYAVKVPVGLHEINVEANGYATVKQYFEVSEKNQTVSVDLERETAKEPSSTVSGNSISKNLYATLTVEAPVGAEVYEDNIYKGISPVTYQKTAGTHTITFRKTGFVTTSYNVAIEDDGKNQTLSFSDMIPDNSYNNGYNTVSGNNLQTMTPSPSGSPTSSPTVSGNSLTPSVSPTPTASPQWIVYSY